MVGVPFVNAEIDFTELKADDYLADSTVKSIYLTKRKLELTRVRTAVCILLRHITLIL